MPVAALPEAGEAAGGLLDKLPMVGKMFGGGGGGGQPKPSIQSAAAYTSEMLSPHQFGH